jgi:hypothetical protein
MYGHALDQLPPHLEVCQDGLGVVPMSGTISSRQYGESRAVSMEREIKVTNRTASASVAKSMAG